MIQLLKQIVAVCIGLGFALAANSQSYPQKVIKIVLPFAAGSGSDVVTRILAANLTESLKQSVIVENRPGANGVIAAEFVAKSAPDGYTLFIGLSSTHSANPSLMKALPYDPIKDFAPVAQLGTFLSGMLVIDPRLPIQSVVELIAYAKANPGKLTYGTGNSNGQVTIATLARMAGIDILHVPYKSTPPAMADVIGGQVSMMFLDIVIGLNNVRAGKLRVLAVMGEKPLAALPGVPPIARTPGFEGFNVVVWVGAFAPAGTPLGIIELLNREIVKIVTRKDMVEKFAGVGFDAFGSTPQGLSALVASELVRWAKMVKDAGIQAE